MPNKRLKCEYEGCPKSYCSSFNLKRHIELIHLGVKKFKCTFCGRFLSSKQNLIDHLNIHSGSKPYACEFENCGQAFRQLSQYYIHRQLHNEVNNQMLNRNFVSNSVLRMLTMKLATEPQNDPQRTGAECEFLANLPKIAKKEWTGQLPSLERCSEIV